MDTRQFRRLGDSDDTFRREFGPLSEETKAAVGRIKRMADELIETVRADYIRADDQGAPADPHYLELAQTDLERFVMWAVKGLTK